MPYRMTRAGVRRLVGWSLVAAWLVVVWQFGESQALLVTATTGPVRLLARKGLHVVVYGLLASLLTFALGRRRWWWWVILFCLLVALGDELHQEMVPGRHFYVLDLSLDLLGAALGAVAGGIVVARAADGPSPERARSDP